MALALKGADEDLAAKVSANVSSRARDTLAEEGSLLVNAPKAKVEAARAGVLAVVRRLEEEGRINLDSSNAE